MLVELDVFSGKPNPRWTLDESGSARLRQLQGALTLARRPPPEPPGLGYRGFVYSDPPGHARAYRGYVTAARMVLADPTFSIELYLLDQLPAQYDALRRRIASELAGTK